MKVAVVFLSLIALGCTSSLVDVGGSRTITIAVGDDGTITIEGSTGTRVFISRNPEHRGPRNIEVFSEDTTSPMKRIWVDRETSVNQIDSQIWETKTEADILVEIFKRWEGRIDVALYEALLERVMLCIQNGHINMVVYKILKCINVEYVSLEHCVFSSNSINTARFWSILNGLRGIQTTNNQITGVRESGNSFGYIVRPVSPDMTTTIQSLPVGNIRQNPLMRMVQSVPDMTTVDRQGFMMPMVQSVPDVATIDRQSFMVPMVQSVPDVTTVERQGFMVPMVESVPDVTTIDRQSFMVPMVQSVPDVTTVERQGFMVPVVQSIPDMIRVQRKMPMMPMMVQSVPDDTIVY